MPWIPALVIIGVILAGVYFWIYGDRAPDVTEPPVAEKTLPDDLKVPGDEPAVKYPVPDQEPTEEAATDAIEELTPEPSPAEPAEETTTETETVEPATSPEPVPEPTLEESLRELLGRQFEELLIPDSLVRHFVVTVDNMTTEKLPQRFRFARSPEGKFAVDKKPNGDIFLDPVNFERYTPFVNLAQGTDLERLVDVYVRHYQRFQSAYENLGYPDRYFNDRLVEVIDHLLAAPEVSGRIALAQPKVFYRFNNPRLEALSAGQKIMVRMGPANADRVKARLRELRRLLTGLNQA